MSQAIKELQFKLKRIWEEMDQSEADIVLYEECLEKHRVCLHDLGMGVRDLTEAIAKLGGELPIRQPTDCI